MLVQVGTVMHLVDSTIKIAWRIVKHGKGKIMHPVCSYKRTSKTYPHTEYVLAYCLRLENAFAVARWTTPITVIFRP